MCINDTSLINLTNNDAMNVLKVSLEKAKEKGTIRIIIGRQAKPVGNHIRGASSPVVTPVISSTMTDDDVPTSPIRRSSPRVSRKTFQRPPSPSLDRSRKTPERFSPRLEIRRKLSTESKQENDKEETKNAQQTPCPDSDKEFDERYLQRGLTPGHFAIGRNKSYFRAVNTQPVSATEIDITDSTPPRDCLLYTSPSPRDS